MGEPEKAIGRYLEKFGEDFPIFLAGNMSDEELVQFIDNCIAAGEPYRPPFNPDAAY